MITPEKSLRLRTVPLYYSNYTLSAEMRRHHPHRARMGLVAPLRLMEAVASAINIIRKF
tara:strand:- start:83 stop:259 length:177 start_codon:yes stop_codon:yes gene_type:complete